MGEPVFRSASRDDVPAIVAMLADDALGSTRESIDDLALYESAFDAMEARDDQVLVVVERDGEVVGTAQLTFIASLSRRGTLRCDIEAVRVRSDQRGSGLGTTLMNWCVDTATARGCGIAQLTTDATRVDAHRFYESLGFRPTHIGFRKIL